MKQVVLPCGESVPVLGMGTWNMGDDPALRQEELATLQLGIDNGLRLIDTAEMYGEGASERLVGQAIAGRREQVFLVSKVYPHNASRQKMRAACGASLQRLGTDRIDLYLLHWRGSVPLAETVEAMQALQREGWIRHWGVSNLDLADMHELQALPGGREAQLDQVLYNLMRRGVEWDLVPWLRAQGKAVMAYSPVEQGRLLRDHRLAALAQRHGMTPAQMALAWVLRCDGVVAIPKTASRARLQDNLGALQRDLDAQALAALDRLFPPPTGPAPLEML
ncbi:aldo/keto reductase [uncultured Ramlibacter sp.]|uniref:aldo/keto reductase n=1 Tax=uncultured Ramlibacter sp. TaxID=260755 RepID=UPI00260878BF|nr:aldo/keto reductase [uncultured Ramlibacter sp.]